jgi:hypothetical protein
MRSFQIDIRDWLVLFLACVLVIKDPVQLNDGEGAYQLFTLCRWATIGRQVDGCESVVSLTAAG